MAVSGFGLAERLSSSPVAEMSSACASREIITDRMRIFFEGMPYFLSGA
jgi:hypothetical protein